jgi:hypothetical protein
VQTGDEPIVESTRSPARRTATAGDSEVDLADEAPFRAADHYADPPVTQHSTTLGHLTPEEGDAPLFENSDEEPEYLRREDARLEKQRKIERLRTRVLGKNTHQRGELLDALAEPPALKWPTLVKSPTKRATVMPPDYGGHKQKDFAAFIRKVDNVLEFDLAVYPTERDRMLFQSSILSAMPPPRGISSARGTQRSIIPEQL